MNMLRQRTMRSPLKATVLATTLAALTLSSYGYSQETDIEVTNSENSMIKLLSATYTGGSNCDAMKKAVIEMENDSRFVIVLNRKDRDNRIIARKIDVGPDKDTLSASVLCDISLKFAAEEGVKVYFSNVQIRGNSSIAAGHYLEFMTRASYGAKIASDGQFRTRASDERFTLPMTPLTMGVVTKAYNLPCGGVFTLDLALLLEIKGRSTDTEGSLLEVWKVAGEQESINSLQYNFQTRNCP